MKFVNYIYLGCVLVLLLFIGGHTLTAQNLLDNQFYREAEQLKQDAKDALDNGDFSRSIELSRRSRELSDQAYDYAEQLYLAFIARAAKLRAEDLLDLINSSPLSFPENDQILIEDGRAFYQDGVILFDEDQYELSTLTFLDSVALLTNVNLTPEPVEPEPEPETEPEPVVQEQQPEVQQQIVEEALIK